MKFGRRIFLKTSVIGDIFFNNAMRLLRIEE